MKNLFQNLRRHRKYRTSVWVFYLGYLIDGLLRKRCITLKICLGIIGTVNEETDVVSLPDFHSEPMLTDLVLDETASTSSRTTMGRRPRGARSLTCEIPVDLAMWSSNELEFNAMLARRVAQRMQELNHMPTLVNPNNIPVGTPIVRSDYENWRLSPRKTTENRPIQCWNRPKFCIWCNERYLQTSRPLCQCQQYTWPS